jgi:hypothetical protein
LTYPFLSKTKNYQARKSVWVNLKNGVEWDALNIDDKCATKQNEGCWQPRSAGQSTIQFMRGWYDINAALDTVDITMNVDSAENTLNSNPADQLTADEYMAIDWVYLCEATFYSEPEYPQEEPESPPYPASGQWDKCQEIPQCTSPFEPAGWTYNGYYERVACYEPRALDGSESIQIRQSEFEKTNRFNTNSAIWIVGTDDFNADNIADQCEIGQEQDCWRAIGKGPQLYKLLRGMSFMTTNLDTAVISIASGAAERMIICDADQHSFDVNEPEPDMGDNGKLLRNKYCMSGLMWHNSEGEPSRRWVLSEETFSDLDAPVDAEKIYVDGNGNYLWWGWIGFSGRWYITKTPGRTTGTEAIMQKIDNHQLNCPYNLGHDSWLSPSEEYTGSYFLPDNCEKRIRACRPWDNPETADCFAWETSYNKGTYSGRLTYPFLKNTQYYQARKSVWVGFDKEILRNDLDVDDACEPDQNEGCWQRNKNGVFSFQFTRGMNYHTSILDIVDITMHVEKGTPAIGHEFLNMVWVYLCEASYGAEPHFPQPEPESPEPPTCALSALDEVQMDVDDLIANHNMPKGKAKRVARFWKNNVIGQLKKQFGNIKNDQCKVIGQFLCHKMKPESSSFRDTFDWALNWGVVRLGACGGFKQFENKLVKWSQMVNLSAPTLEYEDCPSQCYHDSFQKYLLPRIYQAVDNSYLTKQSYKNKFKHQYIKLMSIIQNDVRNFPTCREATRSDERGFACMTICTLNSLGDLTNWWGARLGDSQVGVHEECPNSGANDPPKRMPKVMRQMQGLENWLCSVNPDCKERSIANFWLPKWADNL